MTAKSNKKGIVPVKSIVALILFAFAALSGGAAYAQNAEENKAPKAQSHEFLIANFKTESGEVLPQAKVVYGTYGTLNAAKDNAVLLPSH